MGTIKVDELDILRKRTQIYGENYNELIYLGFAETVWIKYHPDDRMFYPTLSSLCRHLEKWLGGIK